MTPSQNKAVKSYRNRQKKKGFVRVEVNVPDSDREIIKLVAANLRAGGETAETTRTALSALINPYQGMDLKQLIEAAPLEDMEFERSRETWRDFDF